MPHPGAFKGLRKEFLMNEKQTYAVGVYAANALANIQRRFFKHFPLETS